MTELIGVFGASGFAREVMPLVRAQLNPGQRAVFVDRADAPPLNGHEVWAEDRFLADPAARHFVVAIAEMPLRQRLWSAARAAGLTPYAVRANSCEIQDETRIGPGAILCAFTSVNSNAVIGEGLHLNIYSYIAHDCVIGDFVTFAPRVSCNGNIAIGDGAYIGTGAVLRQGRPDKPLTIGAGAVIGMGAVVTRDVPPGVTVIGNPARPMER